MRNHDYLLSLLENYQRNTPLESLEDILHLPDAGFQDLDFNLTVQKEKHPNYGMNLFLISIALAMDGNVTLLERILQLPDDRLQTLNFNAVVQNSSHPTYGASAFLLACLLAHQNQNYTLLTRIHSLPNDCLEKLNYNVSIQNPEHIEHGTSALHFTCRFANTPGLPVSTFLDKILSLPPSVILKFDFHAAPQHPNNRAYGRNLVEQALILYICGDGHFLIQIFKLPVEVFQTLNLKVSYNETNLLFFAAHAACNRNRHEFLEKILLLPDKVFHTFDFNQAPSHLKKKHIFLMACDLATQNKTGLLKRILSLPKITIQNLSFPQEPHAFYSPPLIEGVACLFPSETERVNVLSSLCNLRDPLFTESTRDIDTNAPDYALLALINNLRTVINAETSELDETQETNINNVLIALESVELDSKTGLENSVYSFLANAVKEKYGIMLIGLFESITSASPQLFKDACQNLAEYYFAELSGSLEEGLSTLLKAMEYGIQSYPTSPSDTCLTLITKIVCAYWATTEKNLGKTPYSKEKYTDALQQLKELLKESHSIPQIKAWVMAQRIIFILQDTSPKQQKEIEPPPAQPQQPKTETSSCSIAPNAVIFSQEASTLQNSEESASVTPQENVDHRFTGSQ